MQFRSISPPQTQKQVCSFIGKIGFYRRVIPHFAEISAVLTDLTSKRKYTIVKWSDACDFILQRDACERGFGAVLLQTKGECRHPIILISKKLL